MKEFKIIQEPLLLQNFLKLTDYIQTGGQSKIFLQENEVLVNNEKETRRGRKLYNQDKVIVNREEWIIKLDVG